MRYLFSTILYLFFELGEAYAECSNVHGTYLYKDKFTKIVMLLHIDGKLEKNQITKPNQEVKLEWNTKGSWSVKGNSLLIKGKTKEKRSVFGKVETLDKTIQEEYLVIKGALLDKSADFRHITCVS